MDSFGTIKMADQAEGHRAFDSRPDSPAHWSPDSPRPPEITIAPGGTITCKLRVERNGFDDRIAFDVANLPHGIIVDDIGLSGVLIPEKQTERTIFLRAEPWVPEQSPHILRHRPGRRQSVLAADSLERSARQIGSTQQTKTKDTPASRALPALSRLRGSPLPGACRRRAWRQAYEQRCVSLEAERDNEMVVVGANDRALRANAQMLADNRVAASSVPTERASDLPTAHVVPGERGLDHDHRLIVLHHREVDRLAADRREFAVEDLGELRLAECVFGSTSK